MTETLIQAKRIVLTIISFLANFLPGIGSFIVFFLFTFHYFGRNYFSKFYAFLLIAILFLAILFVQVFFIFRKGKVAEIVQTVLFFVDLGFYISWSVLLFTQEETIINDWIGKRFVDSKAKGFRDFMERKNDCCGFSPIFKDARCETFSELQSCYLVFWKNYDSKKNAARIPVLILTILVGLCFIACLVFTILEFVFGPRQSIHPTEDSEEKIEEEEEEAEDIDPNSTRNHITFGAQQQQQNDQQTSRTQFGAQQQQQNDQQVNRITFGARRQQNQTNQYNSQAQSSNVDSNQYNSANVQNNQEYPQSINTTVTQSTESNELASTENANNTNMTHVPPPPNDKTADKKREKEAKKQQKEAKKQQKEAQKEKKASKKDGGIARIQKEIFFAPPKQQPFEADPFEI